MKLYFRTKELNLETLSQTSNYHSKTTWPVGRKQINEMLLNQFLQDFEYVLES